MGDSDESDVSVRKCTKCKRPVRGHEGPTGASCPHPPPGSESAPQGNHSGHEQVAPSLTQQLVDLMSQLNAGMQAMSATQHAILHELKSLRPLETASEGHSSQPISGGHASQRISGGHASQHISGGHTSQHISGGHASQPVSGGHASQHISTGQYNPSTSMGQSNQPATAAHFYQITSAGQFDGSSTINMAAPDVSSKSKLEIAACNGEFINLPDLLPDEAPLSDNVEDSKTKETTKRQINNFLVWLKAWSIYERMIIQTHPEVYHKLAEYRVLIQDCDTKYAWSSIHNYDVKFRQKLACGPVSSRLNFDCIDSGLFVTILDATAVKPRKLCFRCHSSQHNVANCPFRTPQASMAAEKKTGPPQRFFFKGTEICNNFQAGRCNFRSCTRAHVCRQCFGPSPWAHCERCQRAQMPNTDGARWSNSHNAY